MPHEGENLRRLLSQRGLTLAALAERSGVDRRTIRSVLRGSDRVRPATLGRLATALGVAVDEFFVEPAQLAWRTFDHRTNPAIDEVVASRPRLFDGWTPAEFDELASRVGTGGPMTAEGVAAAASEMNDRRELHEKLSLLLESHHAPLVRSLLELLYEQVVVREG